MWWVWFYDFCQSTRFILNPAFYECISQNIPNLITASSTVFEVKWFRRFHFVSFQVWCRLQKPRPVQTCECIYFNLEPRINGGQPWVKSELSAWTALKMEKVNMAWWNTVFRLIWDWPNSFYQWLQCLWFSVSVWFNSVLPAAWFLPDEMMQTPFIAWS